MMPLRMVDVTSPPASTAPANSNTAAINSACFIEIALAPVEVAMALATSFAPIPPAMDMPKTAASPMYSIIPSMRPLPAKVDVARGSARDQALQQAADPVGQVAQVAQPLDGLVEEDHVDRRQLLLDAEHAGPQFGGDVV